MSELKNSSNSSKRFGNTKYQISPSKHWAFTWNNYPKEVCSSNFWLKPNVDELYIQEEICPKTGTPHLQGSIKFKRKVRPKNLYSTKIHWEKTRNIKGSNSYCLKEESRKAGGWQLKFGNNLPYTEDIKEFKAWQVNLLNILKKEPDNRSIYWCFDYKGGIGKTIFQKYVFTHLDNVIVVSGKGSDMKNCILTYLKTNKRLPKIILVNVPRSSLNFISWSGIEEIKDMFFYSPKYEGGMICGPSPHLFLFANEKPPLENLSKDRWKTIELK